MKFLSSLSGALQHHIGTLILSLVLAASVAYYALVYLPQRRHELEQRYFRVLARVGHNIQDRVRVHQRISEQVASVFSIRNFPKDTLFDIKRDIDQIQRDPARALTSVATVDAIQDAWFRLLPFCADLRFDRVQQFDATRPTFAYRPEDQNLVFQHRLWKPLTLDQAKANRFLAADSSAWSLFTIISASRFVQPFVRQEAFQNFYVADANGQLIYANHAHGPTGLTRFLESKQDTTHWQVQELEINGQPSILFMLPLRLRADKTQVWYLAGTVSQQEFRTEQHNLPRGLQELLFGGLLLGLLSLPFLKVSLLNEHERLNYGDVVQCGVSLLLGSGLLTLTLVAELTRRYPETDELDKQLQQLGAQVQNKLYQELSELNTTLAYYRREYSMGATDSLFAKNTEEATMLVNRLPPHDLLASPSTLPRPLVKEDMIIRVDQKGNIIRYLRDPQLTKPLLYGNTLKDRKYFRMARRRQWMHLPRPYNSTLPFTLDGIISYRQAVKTAALVQPAADSTTCTLLTQHLRTFQAPILPPDYAFCLIDEQGEILFHSDAQLGLSENLLEDCDSPKLLAALLAHEPATLSVRYQGHDHRLYVRPLSSLGLTLVTLADLRVSRAQHSQAYALGAALLTGMWLVWLLGGLILRAIRPSRQVEVLPRYRFHALWPRRKRAPLYTGLALLLGVVLVVVLLILPNLLLSVRLLLVLVLPLALYPVTRVLLTRPAPENDPDSEEHLNRSPVRQVAVVCSVLVLVNGVIYVAQGPESLELWNNPWRWALLVQGLVGVGYVALAGLRRLVRHVRPLAPLPKPQPAAAASWQQRGVARLHPVLKVVVQVLYSRYRLVYAFLLLGWLGVAGIVPALVCYQTSYQLVRLLHVRGAHLHLMAQLNNATNAAAGIDRAARPSYKIGCVNTYLDFFFGTHIRPATPAPPLQPEDFVRRFYPSAVGRLETLLEPDYIVPRLNQPKLNKANSWSWQPVEQFMNVHSRIIPADGYDEYLLSRLPEPLFSADWWHGSHYAWAAALLTLAALTLVVWLLYHLIRQVFAPPLLNQPPHHALQGWPLGTDPQYYVFNPAGAARAGVLSYLGLSGPYPCFDCRTLDSSTKWPQALQPLHLPQEAKGTRLLKTAHHVLQRLHLEPEKPAPHPRIVLVDHFEFQTEQPAITAQKTALLRWLNHYSDLRIVVISRVHPRAFVDCGHPLEKDCHDNDHHALRRAGNELLDELSQFRIQHLPLQHVPQPAGAAAPNLAKLPEHFLTRECHNLDFIHRIEPSIKANLQHLEQIGYCIERDIVTLTIKRMGMLYFRSLWRKLSAHEQFLLFDLAQDGIINTNNWPVLDSLVRKGYLIIGNDDRLRIMSEGFRAYILSTVPRQQALTFEAKERRQGLWAKLSLPLLLLLASAAVFLAATQGETLSVAQQYLALLTGLVALLLRLFSGVASGPAASSQETTLDAPTNHH
ncbi:PDC sensor domain-containing protein [Hymenobacter metallicola]|uniref:Uncharacterized protein n=1 Tax=Hymenobacter metallicola TaxID=2563114 RepID=A0A4Z0QCT9_9BACT|nr:hypothetical protein [Hymenobacter metallicola]TGE27514.1 hypothetical protein E5K02_14160 [Hymenobacter metallicola]